jgi:mono/diheme cytochrome c family protein
MRFASALLLLVIALPASAQDPNRGRQLYETHCLSCHYERIHNRDPKRSLIKSRTDLRVEVARWAAQVPRSFTPQEVDEIAAYLNRSHYRLEK